MLGFCAPSASDIVAGRQHGVKPRDVRGALSMTTEPNVPFYSIADAEAQRTYVGVRRAAQWVGFFLPHLRVGDAVLDCGCGVGSITLDIAEYVAPGQVIGIDVDARQLALARASATERGLSNVAFEQADIYTLPFADAS